MSLLQSIVEELDRELDRLHSLRKIVAGLTRTPGLVRRFLSSPEAEPLLPVHEEPVAQGPLVPSDTSVPRKPQRKPRRDASIPRGHRAAKTLFEEKALAKSIPLGPVVFYPGRLNSEKKARKQEPDDSPALEAAQIDFDAESRQLAARWAAGAKL